MPKLYLVILFLSAIFISGCEDDITNSNDRTLKGIIYNSLGFPRGGATISIDKNSPYYFTQSDGVFKFDNIVFPSSIYYYGLYKDITKDNIILNSGSIFFDYNELIVNVTVPKIEEFNEFGVVAFLTTDEVLCYNNTFFQGLNSTQLTFRTAPEIQSVHGRMIYLSFMASSDKILSYKNFGVKDVNLQPGIVNEVNFTSGEINFDPQYADNTTTIHTPPGVSHSSVAAYLKFPGYPNSQIYLDSRSFGTTVFTFNVRVPQELTIPFEIEIQNYNSISLNDTTSITDSEKIINTNPGENTEINYIQRPVLVYPQNNETDINENSVFTFGINNPQSVYKIELRELNKSFPSYSLNSIIYTCSNSVTFGELLKYRFSSQNNNPNFLWRVIAYPGFTTVDDYLSFKTNETQDFNNYIGSEFRAFTAHPEAIH